MSLIPTKPAMPKVTTKTKTRSALAAKRESCGPTDPNTEIPIVITAKKLLALLAALDEAIEHVSAGLGAEYTSDEFMAEIDADADLNH